MDDKIGGEKTRYYYNDKWQVLKETDEEGYGLRWYLYGNYIDEVLVMVDPNVAADYYYAHDHLYSPVALIGYDLASGEWTVVERYEYDAYGKPYFMDASFNLLATQKSAYGNPYGFTGRNVDILDNGNLVKQHSRRRDLNYYMGRFYVPDPGGYIDGMNLYEYVKSNSVIYIDPYGYTVTLEGGGPIRIPTREARSFAEIWNPRINLMTGLFIPTI